MSVKQVIDVKVLVVVAKRVDQNLGDVQPAKVEEELEQRGKWNRKIEGVHILVVPNVVLGYWGARGNLHPAFQVLLGCVLAASQVVRRCKFLEVKNNYTVDLPPFAPEFQRR